MSAINRGAVILRPAQPFIDWVKALDVDLYLRLIHFRKLFAP